MSTQTGGRWSATRHADTTDDQNHGQAVAEGGSGSEDGHLCMCSYWS